MTVIIFHGNQDEVIYFGSSLKLKKEFKQNDTLITLTGQDHNGITENADYISPPSAGVITCRVPYRKNTLLFIIVGYKTPFTFVQFIIIRTRIYILFRQNA